VAFEHGVGVKEEYRSQGIGTAMIQAAREFMADRCDLLMVYRGAERSPGYRFYIKSGHQDLLYTRPVKWEPPADLSSQAERIDAETLYEHEDEILPIYNHAYASCGGHPPRQPGYWRQALGGMIFCLSLSSRGRDHRLRNLRNSQTGRIYSDDEDPGAGQQ